MSDLAAYTPTAITTSIGGEDAIAGAEYVTGNYFPLPGVGAQIGRTITDADDRPGSDGQVAVLAANYWRTAFGSDRSVIGRTIRVNGIEHVIIGVAERGYDGLALGRGPDLWIPLQALGAIDPQAPERFASRGSRWIFGLAGRLAEGATVEQARAELLSISDRLAEMDPDARGPRTVTVDPLARRILPTGNEQLVVSFLGILQGVVALTLLLACANLANLLLARASARRQEVSVRLAFGVGRGRLIRQMLTESGLLALVGGVAGLLIAAGALAAVRGFELPFGFELGAVHPELNGTVVLFTACLSVLTGIVFGMAPAILAARGEVAGVLREGRGGEAKAAGHLRSSLVAIQLALCVILLVGAGLFLRTLYNRLRVDLGFQPDGLALVTVDPSMARMSARRAGAAASEIATRYRALPGVTASAVATRAPIREGGSGVFASVPGYIPGDGEDMRIEYIVVTDGFFDAMGIEVLDGSLESPAVASRTVLLDESAVTRWYRDRQPIGSAIEVGSDAYRVTGVVSNAAWEGLETPPDPVVFIPVVPGNCPLADETACAASAFENRFTLYVRTAGDAGALLPSLRDIVRTVDPGLSIRSIGTVHRDIAAVLAPQRAAALLLAAFALLAIVLAAVGVAGVIGYAIAQRGRELSIRTALGARPGDLLRLIARAIMAPAGMGIAFGLLGASLLGGTLERFLFGIDSTDGLTFAAAFGIVAVATTLATLLPARRATNADPSRVLASD
jgi:predicted permease